MNNIQVDRYDALLADKTQKIQQQFSQFDMPELQVFASEPLNFRLRAEFKIWHEGERCFHAMFERGTKNQPIEITDFPIASKAIADLMPKLLKVINQNPVLKNRLFQVEYLNTLSDDMLNSSFKYKLYCLLDYLNLGS